MPRNARASSPP